MVAVRGGESDIVRLLKAAGAEVNSQDEDDEMALIWAAGVGESAVVEQLVAAGADPNRQGEDGATGAEVGRDERSQCHRGAASGGGG